MTKSDLIIKIQKLYPFLTMDQISSLVSVIFLELTKALIDKKRIEIRGFGSFSIKNRKTQISFPKDGKILFEQKNAVYFRMGKEFFDKVNKLND
jgi:integration host factor subunit beta